MSQFDSPSTSLGGVRAALRSILSRLNKISTASGKIRSDGAGTFLIGVLKLHTHLGTGQGGNLIAGVTPNFMTVTQGPPQIIDDSSLGFQIGSQWIDTRANAHYICFDATVGAAVWKVSTTIDATTESFATVRRPRVRWELFTKKYIRPHIIKTIRPRPAIFFTSTSLISLRRPPVRWPLHRKPAHITRVRRPWVGG